MNNINNILTSIEGVLKSRGHIYTASVDLCHGIFLLGAITSIKPKNVLELGIGPAFASEILCAGIKYNGVGQLTCIDNLHDLGGNLPKEKLEYLESNGANIIAPIDEKDFVMNCQNETYDFLVSDADHGRAHLWAEKVFDIMKPNSFMFFHDVCEFKNLLRYKEIADERGYYNHTFSSSSRPDENCHRGWQFIIKK
jgi:predicted O-methyltransferase YrrM